MPGVTEGLVVSSSSMCGVWAHRVFSPDQHASKHAEATGHPIITSFEPGEDWFFDYETQRMVEGLELFPPHAHPDGQPTPGPAGRVPADWESLLNSDASHEST